MTSEICYITKPRLVLTSCILCDRNEWFRIRIEIFWHLVHPYQLHIVIETYNATFRHSLNVLFRNETGLVIEKTVRISTPSHTAHVDPKITIVLVVELAILTRISAF